jgi:hypothetical protein
MLMHMIHTYTRWSKRLCAPDDHNTSFLPHYLVQPDCLSADRQGQGDTGLILTSSVIPNSNYVIMISDWNCLKYFCMVFFMVIIRCIETFWSPVFYFRLLCYWQYCLQWSHCVPSTCGAIKLFLSCISFSVFTFQSCFAQLLRGVGSFCRVWFACIQHEFQFKNQRRNKCTHNCAYNINCVFFFVLSCAINMQGYCKRNRHFQCCIETKLLMI